MVLTLNQQVIMTTVTMKEEKKCNTRLLKHLQL